MPAPPDIEKAASRIAGHARVSPVMRVGGAELGVDVDELVLKLEYVQASGSFKARGALNNLLTRDVPAGGVVTASGGNHGIAVAWAASRLGYPATIFVPSTSSPTKLQRVQQFDATVHTVEGVYSDAQLAADQLIAETDAMAIHPYDHLLTVAGAGTLGRELSQQAEVDTVVVACGGGGLAAGVSAWYQGSVRIVAVEGQHTNALAAARAAGEPVTIEVSGLTVDALGASRLGDIPFALLSGDEVLPVTVTDESILDARQALWDSMRVAVEPAAATVLAAVRTGAYPAEPGERVALVLCGANTSGADLT